MTTIAELTKVRVQVPTAPMTLKQWEKFELPEGVRAELVEGMLEFMAPPTRKHMDASRRLANLLEAALSNDWAVTMEVGIVLWESPTTERVPDIAVYPSALNQTDQLLHLFEGQVLLVVEIVSPGSRRLDQRVKRQEYQDASIPHYWVIDLDAENPAERFLAFALHDGAYQPLDVLSGNHVRITEPCVFEFDIADLTRNRA